MKPRQTIAFVGQGPNRASWERGLERGRYYAALRLGVPDGDPRCELPALSWAESFCAIVAVTGAVGRKLGQLGGFKCDLRFGGYARRNLNCRFNGKAGKGDIFSKDEGRRTAARIEEEGFERLVLLGAEVARCFGADPTPLAITEAPGRPTMLSFPHPSGINTWWNDLARTGAASFALRTFIS